MRLCLLFWYRRPKIIYCPHGWAFGRDVGLCARVFSLAAEYFLAFVTDRIICVANSERRAAVAVGIPKAKCVVVRNGIADLAVMPHDRATRSRGRNGRLKILYVGRFDHQKGFDIYLEVMRHLEDFADGLAVGDFIVTKPGDVDLPHNVTALGWTSRDGLQQHYEDADCF